MRIISYPVSNENLDVGELMLKFEEECDELRRYASQANINTLKAAQKALGKIILIIMTLFFTYGKTPDIII